MNRALTVNNISKSFRDYGNEWRRVASWFGASKNPKREYKVLRNITFSAMEGESIGIVGQNGAGKSTLLKIIAKTLKPSEGTFQSSGLVVAILELGMGFHPDLTGRQNARYSASLMGHTPQKISLAMDDIESFTEIGEYFDRPVRTYSSGMQVRLAFSVATAFRPDVFIIDEALSVGDVYFQAKCFDRIRKFREQGTALLIVSHDRSAILNLCDRVLFLEDGKIAKDGKPEAVMDYYNAVVAKSENSTVNVRSLKHGKSQVISGTGEATVDSLQLIDEFGKPVEVVSVGEKVRLRAVVQVQKPIERLVFGFGIKDRLGQVVYGTNTEHLGKSIKDPEVGSRYQFLLTFSANLGTGDFSIHTALTSTESHLEGNYEWRELALLFNVINTGKPRFIGNNWIDTDIEILKE